MRIAKPTTFLSLITVLSLSFIFAFSCLSAAEEKPSASSASDTIYFAVYKGVDPARMESIIQMVSEELFNIPIKMLEVEPEVPAAAYVETRKKYYAGKMVEDLTKYKPDNAIALIALTNVDIFIGRRPHIRGLANPETGVGIVSLFRMNQGSDYRMKMRLLKETLHELGHLLGQEHCDEQISCVMAYSVDVETLDLKYKTFCPYHKRKMEEFLRERGVDMKKFELPQPPAAPTAPTEPLDPPSGGYVE